MDYIKDTNALFEKYGVTENTNRYICTSSAEFLALMHKELMDLESKKYSDFKLYAVDSTLKKLTHFETIMYRSAVFNQNIGLCLDGTLLCDVGLLISHYDEFLLKLLLHFETHSCSVVADVSVQKLMESLVEVVEKESDFLDYRESTIKALTCVIKNIKQARKVDISKCESGKIEITYKG